MNGSLEDFKKTEVQNEFIFYLQRTMDDMIHMYSGPVRLMLLANLTIFDAKVL